MGDKLCRETNLVFMLGGYVPGVGWNLYRVTPAVILVLGFPVSSDAQFPSFTFFENDVLSVIRSSDPSV